MNSSDTFAGSTSVLSWDVIEPYRQRIFTEALYTFEGGRPRYNLVLNGRGKKNWKSALSLGTSCS